jgi:hypothetical protein
VDTRGDPRGGAHLRGAHRDRGAGAVAPVA